MSWPVVTGSHPQMLKEGLVDQLAAASGRQIPQDHIEGDRGDSLESSGTAWEQHSYGRMGAWPGQGLQG